MASTSKDIPKEKSHKMRRLVGRAMVAGASYAGERMAASDAAKARPKKSHKMRKLIGVAMVAGAAYAAGKMINSRNKRP